MVIFALAALAGAGLLFLIQPITVKLLLPALGGSPSVWNACALFFQTMLLAGYAYAHALQRHVHRRWQVPAHTLLLAATVATLPSHLGSTSLLPDDAHPIRWLLLFLTRTLGPNLFVLCATGPLLQAWWTERDLATFDNGSTKSLARSPYRLYAASNAGSLAGLIAYPTLVEPFLSVTAATQLWVWGFAVYVVLMVMCAVGVWHRRGLARTSASPVAPPVGLSSPGGTATGDASDAASDEAPSWRMRLLWCALAFVPSSLMLGTAAALTTDVAAVPLLFILPLGIYLLTLVLAFAPGLSIPLRPVYGCAALSTLVVAANGWVFPRPAPGPAVVLSLAALGGWALSCHGRLAAAKPGTGHLTEYYLWIAVGGAAGGVFNSVLAPFLFTSIAEYPLVLVLAACLGVARVASRGSQDLPADVRTRTRTRTRTRIFDLALPLGVLGIVASLHRAMASTDAAEILLRVRVEAAVVGVATMFMWQRPARFAAGVAVMFVASHLFPLSAAEQILFAQRTFFGVLRVKKVDGVPFVPQGGPHAGQTIQLPLHHLFHGLTMHGTQLPEPSLRGRPSGYYHPSSPIGQVFAGLRGSPLLDDVGLVGLGAGALAAYAQSGQTFTFFEIDEAVIRIARNSAYFTYLQDSRGSIRTVVGDGRLQLAAQPNGRFGLLVIDAFSSDAVPIHLITQQALALYLQKVRPGGLVAFHLSSEFFDLLPVVAELSASLGATGIAWIDREMDAQQVVTGKQPSRWAVVAAEAAALQPLRENLAWQDLASFRRRRETGGARMLWTDRQASPLSALR